MRQAALLCLTIILLALPVSNAQSAQPKDHEIPLDDFVKHSDYLDVKISPDGKHFATRFRVNDTVSVAVLRVSDGKTVGGIPPGDKNAISSVHWATNNRLVYTFAEKRSSRDAASQTGELFAIDIDGKANKMLAGFRAEKIVRGSRLGSKNSSKGSYQLLNTLPDDDKHVLVIEYPWSLYKDYWYDRRETKPIVSRLNIYTGKKTRSETIPYHGARVFANDKGQVKLALWSDDSVSQKAVYRESKDHPWENISLNLDIANDLLIPVSINKTGDKIYLEGAVGKAGITTLFEFSLQTKEMTRVFDNNAELDFWNVDLNREPIVGTSYLGNHKYHYSLTNSESVMLKHHQKLQKAFPEQEVQISTFSDDGKLLVLNVTSATNPGEYYLYNTQTQRADFIWANYSWIDPRTLAPTKAISLDARDGQKLHGYLTTPKDHVNRRALVVLPHGGPHGVRDYPNYDPEVQLLASRGYSVLQINFRGSYGYGTVFEEQGYKNWGKVMVDDVIDATHWAVNEGVTTKNNVCIYGASYGGYSALMSAARAPDLYQCAIGYVGVYDLEAMKTKGDIPIGFRGRKYLDTVLGSDTADLKAQSPLTHADKIKASVMLIHGDEDIRVPSYHAKKMRTALKKANNAPQWLYLDDAGHGAFSTENRTKVYEAILKFLDEHIGGSALNQTAGG